MQENAEATEDDQLYGNYDYYGETPLSDNAGINVQSISTLEAYGGTLGENAPESGYVIEVTATTGIIFLSDLSNVQCGTGISQI